MNERLETNLKKLRLSGMAASLDVRLQEATANHLTHAEFLELVDIARSLQTGEPNQVGMLSTDR